MIYSFSQPLSSMSYSDLEHTLKNLESLDGHQNEYDEVSDEMSRRQDTDLDNLYNRTSGDTDYIESYYGVTLHGYKFYNKQGEPVGTVHRMLSKMS